ncbi:hypothetical protein HDU93_006785 [Gonapodya sp. JEL0774]|nr:hypothetical protein HDU93_006785 [Gonapodya sp. JEL0774]
MARTEKDLMAVVSEIASAGGKADYSVADCSNKDDIDAGTAKALEKWGTVDILVVNHDLVSGSHGVGDDKGIFPTSRLEETTVEFFDHLFAVNVRGVFLAVKSVLPTMVKNKKGRIILMSSTSGFIATPGLGVYVATKHAVEGLSKSFAAELTKYRDITCNVVQPGWIHTPAMETFAPTVEEFEAAAKTVPVGYVGEPRDIAHACVFLASDESRYMTGKSICLDGGLTLSDVPDT